MAHILYGVKRNSDIGLDYGTDGLELSFTETYRVRADSKTAEQWEVMRDATATDPDVIALLGTNGGVQSTGLPLPGYTISRDGICRCRNLNGQRPENNPLEWEFSATWSSKVQDGRGGASQSGDPTVPLEEVIPIRETMYDPVTRVANVDFQGRMYQNGASQPFVSGLSSDEELPRWDFAQFDRNYEGSVSSFSTTYVGMTGEYSVLTEPDYTNSLQPWVWAPGVYRQIAGGSRIFWAPTDQTVFFLNGCINMIPWLGYPAFTLLLRVRSSRVGYYNGTRKRLTEFSVVYDRKNWHDKALDAGPYFLAPELDDNGDDKTPENLVLYPYIYYSKDVEDGSEDLAIDQNGLLTRKEPLIPGMYDLFMSFSSPDGSSPAIWRTSSTFFETPEFFGRPYAGAVKVTTVDNKKTYRATRPAGLVTPNFIEFQNRDIVNFAYYLRPTLVGPYIA